MNLPPFALERYFARYEFNVKYILCASDCESVAIKDLLALEPGAADRFQQLSLGYTESLGSPTLRQQIARIYTSIQPEQVLVHSGAEEAIFLFMHAALQPGDHVIVHSPCYQSLAEVARSIGCDVTEWCGDEANGWALDLDVLRRSLRSTTRVIVVNTPHNPTGLLISPADYWQIHAIAQERGILVFSDEVYRESEYNPADRLPAGCDLSPSAVSLGVMSKTYGLPGLRVGWIATQNQSIYQKMAALKDYTTICSSAPSEFLSELALSHRQQLAQRNIDLILHNLNLLDGFFKRQAHLFTWQRPKAGSIAFPRYLGGAIDPFCEALVQQTGVLLLPGTLFGDRENHFRLGFGRANTPQAIERLEEYVENR